MRLVVRLLPRRDERRVAASETILYLSGHGRKVIWPKGLDPLSLFLPSQPVHAPKSCLNKVLPFQDKDGPEPVCLPHRGVGGNKCKEGPEAEVGREERG